ncbi:alcohol dehydrogenase catalytic domain-containing protein [Lederbergia citri]|uniref:Alcohol dehydrogenase catalytic domain-containing protein n=1 Tax=Lederbergia citri TaxID=2833580 RepID=A0A942TFA1_9BACI|nr:alcohol dehydrogenase catalytic domain-containing protein [Lederbergia citri]MBS4195778.1 alcohol dehydrogenase catalytic domain-containing protein [Lederbergia citri]
MRSAVYLGPKEIQLEEFPEEELQVGDVRIKIGLCGICGSDIKTYLRGTPYFIPPAVLGHEVVGTVVESRNNKWKIGNRVAVAHYIQCGTCPYCLAGNGTLCPELFNRRISPGGFAEYLRVPRDLADRATFKLADSAEFLDAVLAEPLACCIHGAKKVGIPVGGTVLVIGDGPMGLLHLQTVRAFGAGKVILSGMTPERLEIGRYYADFVINANEADVHSEVKKLTDGLGPDVIIVAVASVGVAEQAIKMVRSGGGVLLFGGFSSNSELKLDPNRVHYDEVRIVGSLGSLPEEFHQALEFLVSKKVSGEKMFTNLYSLDQVGLALERGSKQIGVKAIVDPWAPKGTDKILKM